MKGKSNLKMIRVRAELCVACGRCAEVCPQQAISIVNGRARINQALCNRCRLCMEVCPRNAIVETVPVSREKLAASVEELKHRTDILIERIEKLQQKRETHEVQRHRRSAPSAKAR